MITTPYSLSFELPGLTRMANNSGRTATHWRAKARDARLVKRAVMILARPHRPKAPLKRAHLTLTRCSSVSPDSDGMVSGFKYVIDGLVAAGVLENDRFENIGMPTYLWEKAAQKEGKLKVVVTEVGPRGRKEG